MFRFLPLVLWLLSCASPLCFADEQREPPPGFVDLATLSPNLSTEPRYATASNFTGAPLPGYGVPGAWLRREAATALRLVAQDLAKQGLALRVYDAYRPKRATQAMWAWAMRTGQTNLFKQGYISSKSGHNHGHTVDLTLVDHQSQHPLDMGTEWDVLNERANTANAKGEVLKRRLLLKRAMQRRGFKPYEKEWWHFSYVMTGTSPRDVPYSCFEANEDAFVAPPDWHSPTYQAPTVIPRSQACAPNAPRE